MCVVSVDLCSVVVRVSTIGLKEPVDYEGRLYGYLGVVIFE